MRTLIYQTLASLDGYVGGPHGELDWHQIDPAMHEIFNVQQRILGGYVMGRRTYEVMRAWDELGGKPDDAAEYRGFHGDWIKLPKLVFSRTLNAVGRNATLASGAPAAEVAALKAEAGGPLAVNGTSLALQLAGLIDEVVLYVHPVLLGGGTPVFPEGWPRQSLRLAEATPFAGGVTRLRYLALA